MKNKFKEFIKKLKATISANKAKISNMIGIITNICTIVSAIIVVLTLHEMQIQRNNAYMPDIVFEPVSVNVSWGDTSELGDYTLDSELDDNPTTISLPTKNIGVGVAKQLTYSIDSSTYVAWLELLNSLDTENEYWHEQNGNHMVVNFNGAMIQFSAKQEYEKVFLLPNAEETFEISLPMQYTRLLEKIYSLRGTKHIDIPDLRVNVTYKDVQGIDYEQDVVLSVETIFLVDDGEGNGLATYKITMK